VLEVGLGAALRARPLTFLNTTDTLEIGLEFRLDLRSEDLVTLKELGAGNGGTVQYTPFEPSPPWWMRASPWKQYLHFQRQVPSM
jgi:hypothetical protein